MDNQENKVSEKQVPKKPSLAKSIFKWLFVGVLAFFLIAAIIFQAPWKVATLLVIFLLACTVLPKPFRKWFWLSVGVVVLALVIWVFLPEDNEGWRPYTFDEELAALQAKYAIPDSENAALIYNRLLDSYDANAFELEFMDPNVEDLTGREPWSSKDYPRVAKWLQERESTIAKLLEASKVEKCRFPIADDLFALEKTMERLPAMRRWSGMLTRAANNDLAENRTDQALEKYATVLRMAQHLYQQPAMIDVLVGMAIESLATERLKRFIVTGNATETHLNSIEETLTPINHDWCANLLGILEQEKLSTKNLLCRAYEINSKGKIRLTRDPTARVRAPYQEKVPPLTYWQRRLMKVTTIVIWFVMPSTPQKLGEIIDSSYERLYAMTKPDYDWRKETKDFYITSLFSRRARFNFRYLIKLMVTWSEDGLHGLHDMHLRFLARQRGSCLLIALRRYKDKKGAWPQSLDDIKKLTSAENLVDPTNGNSFVYLLTDHDFKLYSKGKNKIDDAGKHDKWRGPKTGADDWPIWPSRYYRTKKENTDAE
jgi:hypothetical protein